MPTDNGGVNKKGSNIPVIQYFLIASITVVLICLQNLLFFGIPESRITRFFFNLPDIQSAKWEFITGGVQIQSPENGDREKGVPREDQQAGESPEGSQD